MFAQPNFGGSFVKLLPMFVLGLFFSINSFAQSAVPVCMAAGQVLPVNNELVLQWKTTTQDQFHSRGHVLGHLLQAFPDHSGHHHLEVQIGAGPTDTIEVIYNEGFGTVPAMKAGDVVEACGDYITAKTQAGPYPPSPDGAILHWVHMAPSGSHESGFFVVNGVVCGQDVGNALPKNRRN